MPASTEPPATDPLQSRLEALADKLARLPAGQGDSLAAELRQAGAAFAGRVAAEVARRESAEADLEWVKTSLAAQEVAYGGLVEQFRDGFVEIDRDWRITYVNHSSAGLAGFNPDDLTGKNLWETFPVLCGSPFEQYYRQAMEQRQPASFEASGVLTPRLYAVRVFPSTVGLAMFWADITENRQAETALASANSALEEERERLLAVMEALPVGIAILDREGALIRFNQGYEDIWGGAPPAAETVADYAAYQAWWAETGQPVRPDEWASAQVVRRGMAVTGQFLQIQRFDGRRAYVLNSGAPIHSAGGEVGGCAVALMDITQWVAAENALRESQERFRVALKSVPIFVYTCDRELRYTWVYQVPRGFQPEDVLGKRDDEIIPPAAAAEIIAAKQQALETGQGGVTEVRAPLAGEDTYYLLTTDPIHDRQGQVTGLTCSAIDITDFKRLAAERQEQAIQIEVQRRLLDQREQDRYAVARNLHDGPIQTLSSSMFQLHMINEVFADPDLQAELGKIGVDIRETIHNLRQVMNDLRPPALVHFGLARVIREYSADLRARFPEIEITVDAAADDSALSGEIHLNLFRIFQAGINNIIRHSGASRAWVVLKIDPDGYRLEIGDNGRGFAYPPDLSGLTRAGHFGLAGMRERAEAIGASLAVESAPGQGARVVVEGPVGGG